MLDVCQVAFLLGEDFIDIVKAQRHQRRLGVAVGRPLCGGRISAAGARGG
jgi:hypothetical protein